MDIPTYSDLWQVQEPLLAMAAILDAWLNSSGRISTWRNATADWWINIQLIKWKKYSDVHSNFIGLYKAVYGNKVLSKRRFIASFISSMFFVFILYWIIINIGLITGKLNDDISVSISLVYDWFDYDLPYIEHFHSLKLLEIFFDALGSNVLFDFLSIIETGWILGLALKYQNRIW